MLENPVNQRITTLSTVYMARHLYDQKGGFVCSTLTISALPKPGSMEKKLAKYYWKQWRFLLKNFNEGVKNRAVHLDWR